MAALAVVLPLLAIVRFFPAVTVSFNVTVPFSDSSLISPLTALTFSESVRFPFATIRMSPSVEVAPVMSASVTFVDLASAAVTVFTVTLPTLPISSALALWT